MNRPVMHAGFIMMLCAILVGFVPTIWSIMLLFAVTLLGGHMIKKHAPESYDGFIQMFGIGVIVFNIIAVGLIMMTPLNYIDKSSAAFLNLMVIFIILTLLKLNNKQK